MRKLILFLALIFVLQVGYRVQAVLADDREENVLIENVLKDYFKSLTNRDLKSLMNQISVNYSAGNGNVDKAKFKFGIEGFLKNFKNISISNLKLTKLNAHGNKAHYEIDFNFKATDLSNNKRVSLKKRRLVSLAKEDGLWKIMRFEDKPAED